MEILNIAELVTRPAKRKRNENEQLLFEKKWQHSISGDEFVRRAHKHIDEIYARNKQ